jgi:hypothetical protein
MNKHLWDVHLRHKQQANYSLTKAALSARQRQSLDATLDRLALQHQLCRDGAAWRLLTDQRAAPVLNLLAVETIQDDEAESAWM